MGFTYSPISKDDSTISDKVSYLNENFSIILINIFGLNTGNNFNKEIQLFLT